MGRLNLSGLLLLRGEGLCRQDRNSRSEEAQTAGSTLTQRDSEPRLPQSGPAETKHQRGPWSSLLVSEPVFMKTSSR